MVWNDAEDDLDEDEFPDDLDDDDDSDLDDTTVPCPYCRVAVYDDAERCPHCGHYLSTEDAPSERKPAWIILGVLASLAALLWWILRP